MKKKTLVVDLDGTLCTQEKTGTYHLAKPRLDVIKKVNELWTEGWKIIIFTARGMNTFDGDVYKIEESYREMTEKWLKDNRVCYDQLRFGKPAADAYIDDKGMSPAQFVNWHH
jgi:capsule biosynthesis phosphatase